MRRLLPILLAALLLTACAPETAKGEAKLEVFYQVSGSGLGGGSAVGKQSYAVDRRTDRLHEALHRITQSPGEDSGLISAFPPELRIGAYSLSGKEISVNLTGGYTALPPVRRTLVRCCLVLTLCQLEEVDSVSICEEDQVVEQGLTADILLLESTVDRDYQAELRLWFPAADGQSLLLEQRQLTIAQFKPLAEYAMEELLLGPQSSEATAALPIGTELRSLQISDGLCTVDLSEAFYRNRPQEANAERLAVFALVNSLCELSGVERVKITVEGNALEQYTWLSLAEPLHRAEEFTAPYLANRGWYTLTLYLPGETGQLVPVPVAISDPDYPDYDTMATRAVELLLSLPNTWGYRAPAPADTRLLRLEVNDRICTLFVSPELMGEGDKAAQQAAQSLAATAIDAGNYLGVRIQVGDAPYRNGEILQKEGEWILD